jgi:hypothetical protein
MYQTAIIINAITAIVAIIDGTITAARRAE